MGIAPAPFDEPMNQPLSAFPAPADQATADRDASTPAGRLLASLRSLGPGHSWS